MPTWSELDKTQFFECPEGEAINMFEALYDKQKYDRRFKFGCSRIASTAKCSWTDYLNDYDKPVLQNCDGYIGGIQSIHSNGAKDRRWRIQCCNPGEKILKIHCTETPFINNFQEKIEFKLKPDRMFVGLQSFHDNSKE